MSIVPPFVASSGGVPAAALAVSRLSRYSAAASSAAASDLARRLPGRAALDPAALQGRVAVSVLPYAVATATSTSHVQTTPSTPAPVPEIVTTHIVVHQAAREVPLPSRQPPPAVQVQPATTPSEPSSDVHEGVGYAPLLVPPMSALVGPLVDPATVASPFSPSTSSFIPLASTVVDADRALFAEGVASSPAKQPEGTTLSAEPQSTPPSPSAPSLWTIRAPSAAVVTRVAGPAGRDPAAPSSDASRTGADRAGVGAGLSSPLYSDLPPEAAALLARILFFPTRMLEGAESKASQGQREDSAHAGAMPHFSVVRRQINPLLLQHRLRRTCRRKHRGMKPGKVRVTLLSLWIHQRTQTRLRSSSPRSLPPQRLRRRRLQNRRNHLLPAGPSRPHDPLGRNKGRARPLATTSACAVCPK
jgi:hypothetical protein